MRHNTTPCLNKPGSRPEPARVLLRFVGGLLTVLLTTLLLGELNLPYYGATLWDLGAAALASGLQGLVVAAHWSARSYTFVTGAIGAGWLISIHLRVYRKGSYTPGAIDWAFLVLALFLFAVYFVYEDQVLSLQASVFYRVALYSGISLVSFSVVLVLGTVEDRTVEWNPAFEGLIGFIVIVMFVTGIGTGQHGAEQQAPFFSYRVVNALLHLLATFGAFAMATWFQCEVDDHQAETPSADEVSAAVARVE